MQIMKSLIIGSFPNKVSSYSPSLPDSYTSLISTGSFHVSLRASKLKQSQPNLVRYSNGSFNESSLLSRKCNTRHVANAVSEQPMEPDSTNPQNSLPNALNAFYRFSRPHTVIGTALSIVSVSLLAVQRLSDLSPLFFVGVLEAIVAAFFMNIYIVGLNQLSDIEIDKVNKPYLPLASGEYSVQTGVIIVSSFAVMSFWLGWIVGSWPLFCALLISFLLGTAYSINVPMLRWKRFALVAAMCILAVRAIIVQIAFYLHIQTFVYGRLAVFPKSVIFATGFMSFFSVVIALFKDIPDIVGDKIFGIQSFTVRLGQKRVFWICILLLEVAYGVAILVGASSPFLWSRYITILGHAILGLILWGRAKSTDLDSKSAITSFYMFIWQLFYAEYLLIPLVR
ncbi:homogentisate phytyltransferase 1, chloroplastic [Cynara cardunculus var. scolymus]|uniref:homogentisate phytyltransferase 1, chloroplastic n=1 Tax=Cynara cardunculus var. scolymus TaxID=59895 RepID=UPI000D62B0CB|nr:homogentisate phytyltransferase 1, chloroplastic [Cynara cardunculus var. scolymus]XP_024979520.1 homogentisate phytyltransferase 1, chloroplastic [Cynara cardunculus var. scolymus]XP_024979521.1 homogentisate phytyltransferase 1, chloroplastic [Cynara cardunculus var. scolymus]